jgi:hypothetical protein
MQIDVSTKTLVPCVLNAQPFSKVGKVQGVYCTDASIIHRFFESRYVHFKIPYEIRPKLKVLHQIRLLSVWAGGKPVPQDLLAQLESPFQLKLLKAQTELRPFKFAVETGQLVGAYEFARTEATIQLVASVFGFSAEAVAGELERVSREMRRLSRKGKGRRKARKGK